MNIRLKNRRIFTRILLGFMLILALAALMGGVCLYSLRGVTGVLSQITERSAPSIRYPTGVERYALQTMLDVKSYLLLQDKEIHEEAMRDTQQIYANLDRLDEVATKHNDQDLLQKSRDVRRAVEEYQGYYDRGVALLKENQVLEHKMRMLRRKVNDLSHTHTLDHERLLEEAIDNGIDRKKRMEEFRLCNEIEKEALQASRHEKNCILYKKQEYFERLKRHIANLEKLYDEITKTSCVFEHQSMMKEIRQATKEYLKAAENWRANDNELKEILTEMHEIGIKVQETARAVQETGWQEMDRRKKIAVLTTEKASLTGILAAAIIIIMGTVCAFFIARGLTRPIKELNQATTRIAEGDLKHRVRVQASDEIGQLAISFNKMSERLQKTMVSRDYFDNIIKSMIDTLIVVDAEAKIQTVNPATCDLLGYTEEELIRKPVSIIFAEEEEEEEEVRRVFQFFREPERAQAPGPQDTIRNRELTYKTKDGQLIPMSFNASVLTDKAGNLTGVVAGAKDITELKLKEAEIRKERKFSENIIATIPDSLLVVDKDLRIKSANRTFYETFKTEIGTEAVIGTSLCDILHDKDGKLSTELTKLFGTEDMLENFELCYQSDKLGERIFNIKARGIIFAEEEEEEEEEELVVLEDMTKQKRAEEALRESENKYKTLTESSLTGIFIHHDGRYVFVNDRFAEIHGYKHEELLGKDHLTLIHPDEREVVRQRASKRLKGEAVPRRYEIKRLTKGGETIWCEMMATHTQHRGSPAIMGNVIDITERKRAEEALRESEEKYRTILDSIEEAYFEVDIAGNFTFFNDSLSKILGYSIDELLGMNNRDYMTPESSKKIYNCFNQIYRTGNSVKKVDYQLITKDGRHGFHELSASLLQDQAGQPIGFRGVAHDITERKQAEGAVRRAHEELEIRVQERTADLAKVNEALQAEITERKRAEAELKKYQEKLELMVEERTRELEEAHKELVTKAIEAGRAQLSAMVLHNIGNAVTPMKVHIEQMKASELKQIPHYLEKCYLDLSEHATDLQHYVNNDPRGKEVFSYMGKLVDSLKDHGDHLVGVTKDIDAAVSYISEILSLQHSYAAREQETKERTDLNSLIEDATRMQAGALEKRGISVKKDFDPELPKLLIDKNRLMQVMVNLIKNSYEAIDELKDGSKEKVISIKSFAEDGDIGFEITDNGIGIEPEDMEAVFEFGKSHKGSPGVGLYYCKMFVEANKGTLTLRSPGRGKGATVSVSFPATP